MVGDHPENDLSEFCDQDKFKQDQKNAGQLIWLFWSGEIAYCSTYHGNVQVQTTT